jgi:peptidoglycan/LPS O-acetylase OafA/YrhL
MMFDGGGAVSMFFVLSGFVLAHPYFSPRRPGLPPRTLILKTFYLRRLVRIWLPWFIAFVASIFARRYFFHAYPTQPPGSAWLHLFWQKPMTVPDFFRQCLFSLHDATRMLLPQDWSLGVELRGSLLIPLFIFLARKHVSALAGLAIAILVFHGTGEYYLCFAMGVGAAHYYHKTEARRRSLTQPVKWALLACGVLFYEAHLATPQAWAGVPIMSKINFSLSGIGSVFIIAAALVSDRLREHLHLPPVLFLGRISFSVYLLQFIPLLCFLPWLVSQLNAWGIYSPPTLLIITVLAAVVTTLAMAAVMYRFIERPSIELGRWATRRIQGQSE